MRLSPDLIGLIEIEGDIACERLLGDARCCTSRWPADSSDAAPVAVLCSNLSELTHELHIEWLALVAELEAKAPRRSDH